MGFLKAFSDEPEQLSRGFGAVETRLRCLHLRKLYLWPRFRVEVNRCLAPRPKGSNRKEATSGSGSSSAGAGVRGSGQGGDGNNDISRNIDDDDDGSSDVVAVQELSVGLSPLAKRVQEQVVILNRDKGR